MADSNGQSTSFLDFKPSYVLIAIDTHESMFIQDDFGDTPFSLAIKACYSLADSLLLVQSKRSFCQFAIAFADEDNKASLVDFRDNVINSIKLLKEKSNLSHDELEKAYKRKGTFDLASFFLFCKKRFVSISSVYYKRTIVYITNDDDPLCGDSQKRFTAINEAKNFKSNGIGLEIISMKHEFKYDIFYSELFSVIEEELVETVAEDETGLLEKLSSLIITRYTQRKLHFYPCKNDETRYIPIVKKDLIKEQKLLNDATFSRDGEPLKKQFRGGNNPSNKYILNTHSDIVFSLEEKLEVSQNDFSVGLTLVHVSKRITELGLSLKKNSLIELDEKVKENVSDFRNVFNKFWQYCYEKDRVLVCARKLKFLDEIRFVELIPKFAFEKRIFLMKNIPYQKEIRHLPLNEVKVEAHVTEEQEQVMEKLVEKFTLDYEPKMFCDPVFMRRRAYLKSKMLNEPMEEVVVNVVDEECLNESIKEVAEEFKKLFGLNVESNAKKRKASGAAGSKSKKTK